MRNFGRKRFLGGFIFLAVFALAIAVVMLLWNALIPTIIGWTTINYWQAAGLMLLSRLLLGGFGRFGKFGRGPWAHKHNDLHMWPMLREQMKDMNKEERREFMRKYMKEQRAKACNNFVNRDTSDNGNQQGRDGTENDRNDI